MNIDSSQWRFEIQQQEGKWTTLDSAEIKYERREMNSVSSSHRRRMCIERCRIPLSSWTSSHLSVRVIHLSTRDIVAQTTCSVSVEQAPNSKCLTWRTFLPVEAKEFPSARMEVNVQLDANLDASPISLCSLRFFAGTNYLEVAAKKAERELMRHQLAEEARTRREMRFNKKQQSRNRRPDSDERKLKRQRVE